MVPPLTLQSIEIPREPKKVQAVVGGGLKIKAARGKNAGAWKGASHFFVRVLEISVQKGRVQFRVQHLYKRADLTRDLELHQVPKAAANEMWVSKCEDTYGPDNVLDNFTIFHDSVTSSLFPDQSQQNC
jgi:hypothetical protein